MKKIFLAVFFLVFVCLTILPAQAAAQGLVPCGNPGQPDCSFCHTFSLLDNILSFLLIPSVSNPAPIVLVVATLLFAVGGFFFFISAGSTARLERGKQIITATIIGLLIIYGAWLFIGLLLNSLGVTGSWWEIDCPLPFSLTLTGPASVREGDDVTLEWTISGGVADTCEASGDPAHPDWTGDQSTTSDSKTLSVTGVGTKTYTLDCTGPGGSDFDSILVIVTDSTPPNTIITSNPSSLSGSTSASFSFISTESGTFQCKIDTGGFSTCTSPKSYTLSQGSRTFQVRAIDVAGNSDTTPASFTWTIDICTDIDGDGYGSPASLNCKFDTLDCDDSDSRAHPGQGNSFSTPRLGVGGYDFNCDGSLTKNNTRTCITSLPAPISCTNTKPSGTGGWVSSVPACGESRTRLRCDIQSGTSLFCGHGSPSWFADASSWCGACLTFGGGGYNGLWRVVEFTETMSCR